MSEVRFIVGAILVPAGIVVLASVLGLATTAREAVDAGVPAGLLPEYQYDVRTGACFAVVYVPSGQHAAGAVQVECTAAIVKLSGFHQ